MNFMDCKTETDLSLLLMGVPFKYFINPWREIQVAVPGQVWLQQLQEQCSLFLPACAVFSHAPKQPYGFHFGIFDMWTDVDVRHCTVGLHGQHKRVCTETSESWPWEINPLPQQRIKSVSVLHLLFEAIPPHTCQPIQFTSIKYIFFHYFGGIWPYWKMDTGKHNFREILLLF